jgi:hypothetical protein
VLLCYVLLGILAHVLEVEDGWFYRKGWRRKDKERWRWRWR